MIVTESKNRKIKICDQILEEIYSQIQKNDYDPEKGGIIVGRENLNNENIILEYISKPLKNDICTRTHVELYKAFPNIGGVVHTHSSWATSWAQAGRGIPCYGTTHADYIYGEIPCARCLEGKEFDEYEKNTGLLIVDLFKDKDYEAVPAVLCKNHGPFAWGKDAHEAVHNAVVVEEVAKMAARCEMINPQVKPAPQDLQDKHYYRKHGANAYYGQGNNK